MPHTQPNIEYQLSLPLGSMSNDFYLDPEVIQFCERDFKEEKIIKLRFAIEEYLASDRSPSYLEKVESAIAILKLPPPMSVLENTGLQNKKAGTYLMPAVSSVAWLLATRVIHLNRNFLFQHKNVMLISASQNGNKPHGKLQARQDAGRYLFFYTNFKR